MAKQHISIRIDSTTLHKLHVVADSECRSTSRQVLILIRKCIKTYEQEHGEIFV